MPQNDDQSDQHNLAQLTADIVSAYVARNRVAPADLPGVITRVGDCLRTLGEHPAEPAPKAKPEPAVPVRRSIGRDRLTCLVCGKQQKLLKRHLAVAHDMTPSSYREAFDLKPDYPMAAPSYAQQRRELALEIGLGRPTTPRRGRAAARGAKAGAES